MYVEIGGMGVAKPTRDRAPVEILAVGSREGRMQARAFWDDRRTIRTGITVRAHRPPFLSPHYPSPPTCYLLLHTTLFLPCCLHSCPSRSSTQLHLLSALTLPETLTLFYPTLTQPFFTLLYPTLPYPTLPYSSSLPHPSTKIVIAIVIALLNICPHTSDPCLLPSQLAYASSSSP